MSDLYLKSFVPLSEFDRLHEFLHTRGRPIRTEKFETHELSADGKLSVQRFDGFCLILMKHGSSDELHQETEIRCRDGDFDHVLTLFASLGHFPSTVWKTTRHLIDWERCMIYLDKIEDFGVIVEIKTYAQLQEKEKTLAQAKALFDKLGIAMSSKDEIQKRQQEFRTQH